MASQGLLVPEKGRGGKKALKAFLLRPEGLLVVPASNFAGFVKIQYLIGL